MIKNQDRPTIHDSDKIPDPGPRFVQVSKYVARLLEAKNAGSSRFGPCEVCGKPTDTTYHCATQCLVRDDDGLFWTYSGGMSSWGHKHCVLNQYREHHYSK